MPVFTEAHVIVRFVPKLRVVVYVRKHINNVHIKLRVSTFGRIVVADRGVDYGQTYFDFKPP
ncbi:MAG: hypothetical protein CMJ78_22350 [Planctomycetaceae bacterium]|nr:hypothetical protein [Planctomycetaceae bacterium]